LRLGHLNAVKFYSIGCPSGISVAQSDGVTGKLPLKDDILASRKKIQKICTHVCTGQARTHILVVECTACIMHLAFSWLNFLFNLFS